MTPPANPHTHPHFKTVLDEILGATDLAGMQLLFYLKAIPLLTQQLLDEHLADHHLSLARIRLLLHLTISKRLGNADGMLPSELSCDLEVGRNTVSALLNGLEEQGYIERHNHPGDRRRVLIRITESGEAAIQTHAPETADFVNRLFTMLTPEERATLHTLSEKLHAGLRGQIHTDAEPPCQPVWRTDHTERGQD